MTLSITVEDSAGHTDIGQLRESAVRRLINPEAPYPLPLNHIGINRIALMVPDVDRPMAILKTKAVEFVSGVAPCCSGTGTDQTGIVNAIDPEGVFLELAGSIEPRGPVPQPESCPALEIRFPPAD